MAARNPIIDPSFVDKLKHSPIRNYAIPGLTSWMIGASKDGGCIRLFECSRAHVEQIIPHSHRFDFKAQVLEGTVINRVWVKRKPEGERILDFDLYQAKVLIYGGKPGEYSVMPGKRELWRFYDRLYKAGDAYGMKADEVHSIIFSKGAKVLFEEGPSISNQSIILEPVVDAEVIPTFKVEPWMFQRKGDK
jgi:hypothetical protein